MSSGSERGKPSGIITQGTRVVGAVCIPSDDDNFIEQFNNYYGGIRMSCERLQVPEDTRELIEADRFRMPTWFRKMWDRGAAGANAASVSGP